MLTNKVVKIVRFSDISTVNSALQSRISEFLRGVASESDGKLREGIVNHISDEDFLIVNIAHLCPDLKKFRDYCVQLSELLGTLMVQNDAGDTVIEVFDRNGC